MPANQIKEEVYNTHLVLLPNDQVEAFDVAQKAKELIYKEHIERIVKV